MLNEQKFEMEKILEILIHCISLMKTLRLGSLGSYVVWTQTTWTWLEAEGKPGPGF